MIAIVTLTEQAAIIGGKIRDAFDQADIFVSLRHQEKAPGSFPIEGNLSQFISSIWSRYAGFVFVMAAGIVVRTIAPLLKNKLEDPAVVVIDEKGQHVISLLSGHMGGANELAREIADLIGAAPVITTATDVAGVTAVDDLARQNKCVIENIKDWKKIASVLLENRTVGLYNTAGLEASFPAGVKRIDSLENLESDSMAGLYQGIIYITEKILGQEQTLPYVVLRPRNLVMGIGCKRGKTKEEIIEAIEQVLERLQVSKHSISHLATIELKKDEAGLVEAAAQLGVPLKWVSAGEIKKVENKFNISSFVSEQVGVGAVAEPAAWLTAADPLILSGKTRFPGITVAVVKDRAVMIR